jgi:hypothetical protein
MAIDYRGVGNWADPNGWSESRPASGEEEVKVRGSDTVCTLNTSTRDWGVGQRFRVYEESKLIIEDGARLLGAGWMRVGATNVGTLEQTGGLLRLRTGRDTSKLQIGDDVGSEGSTYTISGGTLTYLDGNGELTLGYRGGQGTFTIIGVKPIIQMNAIYVGGMSGKAASGTIEFIIDSNGVSPISLDSNANLDPEGDNSTANLLVSAIDTPPMADILLVETLSTNTVTGIFDTVNGEPAPEGASVCMNFNGVNYYYNLTYSGGYGNNDIVLQYSNSVPEPNSPE